MSVHEIDTVFKGSVPELYDRYLVPLIFEQYADELVNRLSILPVSRVLEIACGTGVLTRAMARNLPHSVQITATDLNEAMLTYASAAALNRTVEWREADAMAIPFPDDTFDAVVCQFGVMFFPDKRGAFAEARRVLKPGGAFVFNVWDRIDENEFADVVTTSLESLFPDDPPKFLARTPHGYHDLSVVRADLAAAGFTGLPEIRTSSFRSRAQSPRDPAIAYCQGTPLRNEIEARNPDLLSEATEIAASAISSRFGKGEVDGKIQGHLIVAYRD